MAVPADRRKTMRRKVLDNALIRFGHDSATCAILDLSEAGAALDIGAQTSIPDQFTLVVPRTKTYACNVIWRKPGRIGVSFI